MEEGKGGEGEGRERKVKGGEGGICGGDRGS